MKPSDLYPKLEGNHGKVLTIYLKDGNILRNRIFYGVDTTDYGDLYLNISEGKSETQIFLLNIQDVEFNS